MIAWEKLTERQREVMNAIRYCSNAKAMVLLGFLAGRLADDPDNKFWKLVEEFMEKW